MSGAEKLGDEAIFAIVEDGVVAAHSGDPRPAPWWSFGKTLIAATALSLVARGKLALDETLPGGRHTLRHLLGHRAGLGDYGMLAAYHAAVAADETPWTVGEMRRRVMEKFPPGEPGARFGYSNLGYLLVADLIEAASGMSLERAIDALTLAPLGVGGVKLARAKADFAACAWGGGPGNGYDPGWVYHGLLIGPASAAALWLDGLLRGKLLPPQLLAAMRDAQSLPWTPGEAGRPWEKVGYGLGLGRGADAGGNEYEGHSGGGPGSTSAVYRLAGRAVAVFAPLDRPGWVEREAIAMLNVQAPRGRSAEAAI